MKKILLLLVVLTLVFSLVSCTLLGIGDDKNTGEEGEVNNGGSNADNGNGGNTDNGGNNGGTNNNDKDPVIEGPIIDLD